MHIVVRSNVMAASENIIVMEWKTTHGQSNRHQQIALNSIEKQYTLRIALVFQKCFVGKKALIEF